MKMKKLNVEEIRAIASKFIKQNLIFEKLTPDEKGRLMYGYTVSKNIATICYYIPAKIAHEGRMVAEVSIDVFDGRVIRSEVNPLSQP